MCKDETHGALCTKRVGLEGVYLMRKYSHCPILKKCKFFVSTFHGLLSSRKRSTFSDIWLILKYAFERGWISIAPLSSRKMTMGGFIDDISFKGDRLTSKHKLGVVFEHILHKLHTIYDK